MYAKESGFIRALVIQNPAPSEHSPLTSPVVRHRCWAPPPSSCRCCCHRWRVLRDGKMTCFDVSSSSSPSRPTSKGSHKVLYGMQQNGARTYVLGPKTEVRYSGVPRVSDAPRHCRPCPSSSARYSRDNCRRWPQAIYGSPHKPSRLDHRYIYTH